MKGKRVIGLVIAVLLFIATGVSSVLTNKYAEKRNAAAIMEALVDTDQAVSDLPGNQFIAKINVDGTIQETDSSMSLYGTIGYDHNFTMRYIDQLMETGNNVGILLTVNSPGGSVYVSDELYLKLLDYKEATGRPIYCYFEDYACSGGYYIAMAADEIYASRNTWTGSIGVIISTYNYSELFDKLGIEEVDITSGANKAMGSGGIEMTEEQYSIFQSLVDEAYDQFVGIVAQGRNKTVEEVKKVADGRIISAKQALEHGMIDGILRYEEYETRVISSLGEDVTIYEPEFSDFWSSFLGSVKSAVVHKSDAEVVTEYLDTLESGVLQYYAEPLR